MRDRLECLVAHAEGSFGFGPFDNALCPFLLDVLALNGVAQRTGEAGAIEVALDQVILGSHANRAHRKRLISQAAQYHDGRARRLAAELDECFDSLAIWQRQVEQNDADAARREMG